MDRRTFLKLASGALAPLLPGCDDNSEPAPGVPTDDWGATPSGQEHALLPEERRPDGILEIFLMGGLSPWETFYTLPQYGDPSSGGPFAGQQWWSFQEGVTPNVSEWLEQCDGIGRDLYEPFGLDALGQMVNLGPFITPLRDRPDILARMRVWVMAHPLEPHDVAIPLAVAGLPISNPRMAGLGTHIQRFFAARAPSDRSAPFSYSIYQNSLNRLDLGAPSTALGLHPASAQPVALQFGEYPTLPRQLARPAVTGYSGDLDALVNHYAASFRDRLRHAGVDTRAPGLAEYEAARHALSSHEALEALLPPDLFERPEITMCSRHPAYHNMDLMTATDETGAAIQMARPLAYRTATKPKNWAVLPTDNISLSAGEPLSHAKPLEYIAMLTSLAVRAPEYSLWFQLLRPPFLPLFGLPPFPAGWAAATSVRHRIKLATRNVFISWHFHSYYFFDLSRPCPPSPPPCPPPLLPT